VLLLSSDEKASVAASANVPGSKKMDIRKWFLAKSIFMIQYLILVAITVLVADILDCKSPLKIITKYNPSINVIFLYIKF